MRDRLLAAGAEPGFAGTMTDVRWDRNGELAAHDQVLRLRLFREAGGGERWVLGWKGATGLSVEGYKQRRELEYDLQSDRARPEALLGALGYTPVFTIERYVEYYHLGTADVRLEWYPRMDTLIEVEGDGAGIESAIRASGLPRESFTSDTLSMFSLRYAARTGTPAVLTRDELGSHAPAWPPR